MKRALILTVMLVSGVAYADGSNVLVLKSEGRADARTRARIDDAIVKLARTGKDTVTPSEITFSEAAAMVGCRPEEASCRDEVISTLAVDELVIVRVEPKPAGYEIAVKRAGKGGSLHEATATVTTAAPDKVDALAPLFGGKAPTVEPPPKPVGPEPPPTNTNPNPPVTDPVTGPPISPPPTTDPTNNTLTGTQTPAGPSDKQPRDRKRLYLAGMGAGGGMILLGAILWGAASGVQNEIDNAPAGSKADVDHIRDLESRGDSLAAWGNVFTVGGIVLGGVSTYLYIRYRRHKSHESSSTAVLAPTLFHHGGGLTLTFGGR